MTGAFGRGRWRLVLLMVVGIVTADFWIQHAAVPSISRMSTREVPPVKNNTVASMGFDQAVLQSLLQPVAVAAGSTDPAVVGQWSTAANWPLVAVHTSMLPDGTLLMFDAWEPGNTRSAKVWDPQSNFFFDVPNTFSAMFCAAQTQMPDGRQLITGGWGIAGDYGIKDTNIFNPSTRQWTALANMNYERWYATTTLLGDGRVLALGGTAMPDVYIDVPELYSPATNTWSTLPSATLPVGKYPYTYLMGDGRIFIVSDSGGTSRILDPNTWTWSAVGRSILNAGSAMYRPGKVITTGGEDPVVPTTALIDLNQASPVWRQTAAMAYPRSQHNLVVLPDGKVMVTGGSQEVSLNARVGVLVPEMWDPATEIWTPMASMRDPRMYHSTVLLLPDGRVLAAGGGRIGTAVDYPTAEIYSPPYLFNGARPTITNAPGATTYGATISVTTPNAADIASVSFIRFSSVTHAINMDQRYIPLSFTRTANGLNIESPGDANLAPPGYYMMFLVNSAGVPSIAQIVRIGAAAGPDTIPPTVELTAPASGTTVSGTNVVLNATAGDNVGISTVQFLLNGNPIGSPDTAAPFTYSWNSTTTTNGSYTLSVRATDIAGNSAISSDVVVTVNNAPPGSTATPTTIGATPPPTIDNLLVNGDFTTGTLNGWDTAGGFAASAASAYQEPFGVQMTDTGRIDQVINTISGQTYYVSGRVRIDQQFTAPTWGGLRMEVTNFGWQQLAVSPSLTTVNSPTGSWTRVDMTFSANSAQSRITFQNFSGGGRFNASADEFIVSTSPIPPDGQVATPTPIPPTPTWTTVPTNTPTSTLTNTPTSTPVTETGTPTATPIPPTVTSTATPVPADELLANPGFELDATNNGAPDTWSSNANFRRSNALLRTGAYAGRHSSTANAGYTITQTIANIVASQSYDFSGWVNIPATSDAFGLSLRVRWRNASNTILRTDTLRTYSAATTGWNQTTGRLMAPAGTTNAQVLMVVSSLNATIAVDDFSFRAVSIAGTATPTLTPTIVGTATATSIPTATPTAGPVTNVLTNGGFENGSAGGWVNNGDFSIVSTAAFAGNFGTRMSGGGRMEQVFTTIPGQTYYVSAQIRIDEVLVAPAWGGLRVAITDFQSWSSLGSSSVLTTANAPLGSWVRADFTFTATSGSSRLALENFSPGQFAASADEFIVSTSPIP